MIDLLHPHRRIGEIVETLAQTGDLLMLIRDDDGYRVSLGGDKPFSVSRDTLLDALMAAARREPSKRCSRCRKRLPHSSFPAKPDSKDGLRGWCRPCERSRLKKWYPRKMRRLGRRPRPDQPS